MIPASRRRIGSFVLGLVGLLPALALAHPEGHGVENAVAGFLHPFTGIDHLLAMIAVGLWSAQLERRALWLLPIVFPSAMVVGALFAMNGIHLPAIEPMIAASVIVLGVLVAAGIRLPVVAGALIVAAFAVFHGYAHAVEGPSSEVLPYAAGFVGATVMLHLIGVAVGVRIARPEMQYGRAVTGVTGTAITIAGAAILIM